MMDDRIREVFQRQFRVEARKLLDRTGRHCAEVVADANRRGMLLSSRAALQLEEVAKGAEASLADVGLRIALRSYSAAGVAVTHENAMEAKSAIREAVLSQESAFRGIVYSKPPFRLIRIDDSKSRLDDARELEFDRIETEIDLVAMRNAYDESAGSTGYGAIVFNGPVAQVVAGTGNTGTVNQVIDITGARELMNALDGVLQALSSGTPDETEKALIEVTQEAKTEAEKEEPNKFKIGGLISGLNQGLSTIPKARDAFDVLKQVASDIGLF